MNNSSVFNHISNLRQKHALLKEFIRQSASDPKSDLRVKNLKKEKLRLKDRIKRFQNA